MPNFTAKDRQFARSLKISLDDPAPNPLEAAEQRFDQLLASYQHLEAECAQAHRDVKALTTERDQARSDRKALICVSLGLFAGWAFTLWLDGRLLPWTN